MNNTRKNSVEIKNVVQQFRAGFWLKRVEVLHGITLNIPAESVTGILGPNGAGKTTLIQLMTGLRPPTQGTVKICGYDAMSAEAHTRIGYMPERPYFHEHLTGRGLMHLMGKLSGMTFAQVEQRVPVVAEMVRMSHAVDLELRNYSKGMLQRIGIAQAILHDPEVVIFDEPMSGLDPLGRKEMRDLIKTLGKEGKTVIFSSHLIQDVEAVCNQVVVIKKGNLVGAGWIGDFLKSKEVKTELAFSGIKKEDAEKAVRGAGELSEIPEGHHLYLSGQQEVSRVLLKLIELKANILWVQPVRPSLEDLLLESSSEGGLHL